MTADLLRRAATLMRERAEAATYTQSPWGVDEIGDVWAQEADGQPVPVSRRSTDRDAEHIASWHPAVALAVADWLGGMADLEERNQREMGWSPVDDSDAIAVAVAYLGETDSSPP